MPSSGEAMRTRHEIETAANSMSAEERWRMFLLCGVHNWQTLPTTETGEHYCPNCCTIWTADGAIKNVPTQPPT
jgi:hypothetical protein